MFVIHCNICLGSLVFMQITWLDKNHISCNKCLRNIIQNDLNESKVDDQYKKYFPRIIIWIIMIIVMGDSNCNYIQNHNIYEMLLTMSDF